jgi:hypothetical protein
LKPKYGDPFHELDACSKVADLISKYRMLPLTKACGDLASFTTDPLWERLSDNIATGRINIGSSEWPWANLC